MIAETNPDSNDQLGRLHDSLVEHQPDDPDFGDPESWPRAYDSIRVTTGPAIFQQERIDDCFDDLPSDVDESVEF